MDSKPMKWSELRERVATIVIASCHGWREHALDTATRLLADIDVAAPAMQEQELRVAELVAIRDAAVAVEASLRVGGSESRMTSNVALGTLIGLVRQEAENERSREADPPAQ